MGTSKQELINFKNKNRRKFMKPSDFTHYPWDSVLQNSQSEMIARNIMVILKRTGDKFRELNWEEYKIERLKDENFSENEKEYFDKVVDYCKTHENAGKFSNSWNK